MKLSIVATLFKSEAFVEEFHRRATACARQLAGEDYEIVVVNDGSPDRSLELATALVQRDPHVVVVDLSRNFGHHKAMMTGLAHSRGGRVFLIDSDLEEDPEWLVEFSRQMDEEGCDVVYGVQERRKGSAFERHSGAWFYRIFRALTGLELPENIVTARLMSRRYVNALLRHDEREVFMAGLWLITGFDQRSHTVVKHSTSESTYTLRRKMSLVVDSVTSFSNAPLIGIFYVGLGISFIAGAYTIYLVVHWLFFALPPSGWTSVMASIWLLGGFVISFIGIVGIYLSKIYSETKRRPYTILGIGDVGELAHYYFSSTGDYQPVAFTVDAAYAKVESFRGLPVVPFENVRESYAPESHEFFVAIGYSRLNQVRKEKYLAAKSMGYRLASFVSPHATVLNEGRIGDNCLILEDNTIQPFVAIGNNVTLWSGNHIGHHSIIGDHCFITSHVVVSGGVTLGESCFLGVNATLRDRIVVGDRCVIGAGALLLADAAADGVYVGEGSERARVPSTRMRKL